MLTKDQEKYFANSVCRDENGELLRVYHGTPFVFDEFDPRRIGFHGGAGTGFCFTADKDTAMGYMGRFADKPGMLVEAYLNITRPLSTDEISMPKEEITAAVEEILKPYGAYIDSVRGDICDDIDKYLADSRGKVWASDKHMIDQLKDIVLRAICSLDEDSFDCIAEQALAEFEGHGDSRCDDYHTRCWYDIRDKIGKDTNKAVFGTLGYDGFHGHSVDGSETWAAVRPEQIKATDNLHPTNSPKFREKQEKRRETELEI